MSSDSKSFDEEKLLRSAVSWQKRPKNHTSGMGEVLKSYIDSKHVVFEKNTQIVEAWSEVLPPQFYDHCELAAIEAGVLKVEVDPGPFMHEMRLLSSDLLAYIKRSCPGAKVKNIVLCPRKAQRNIEEEK